MPAPSHAKPTSRSLIGLDWFVFFVADVLSAFGPFVAVYLTSQRWTQLDIGLVLTVGGLVALAGQMPGGALVDAARSERFVAGVALVVIGASAVALAAVPIFAVVQAAIVLNALAACVLGPAIAAISLGLVGHAAIGERLGRNARFASLGAGLSAIAMGASGYFLSNQAVFYVTAAFLVPALIALHQIRESEIDPDRAHGATDDNGNGNGDDNTKNGTDHGMPADGGADHAPVVVVRPHAVSLMGLLRRRALVVFAACALLFQLANAAMLPLIAGVVTMRSNEWATVLVASCILVPQLVVAAVSPAIGRRAQQRGRRPLLVLGFAAVALRAVVFATVTNPYLVVAVQVLDGVAAAVFSVMVPFVVADATRGTGRFNLSLGIVGTATGIGASLSTTLAGYASDRFGSPVAFLGLAGIALVGLVVVMMLMPETQTTASRPRGRTSHG